MGIIHSFATVLIDSTHPESTGSYKALTKPIVWWLLLRSTADVCYTAPIIKAVAFSPFSAFVGTLAVYIIFCLIYLPFFGLSFLVSPVGSLILFVTGVLLLARLLARSITFAGYSAPAHRQMSKEFLKAFLNQSVMYCNLSMEVFYVLLMILNDISCENPQERIRFRIGDVRKLNDNSIPELVRMLDQLLESSQVTLSQEELKTLCAVKDSLRQMQVFVTELYSSTLGKSLLQLENNGSRSHLKGDTTFNAVSIVATNFIGDAKYVSSLQKILEQCALLRQALSIIHVPSNPEETSSTFSSVKKIIFDFNKGPTGYERISFPLMRQQLWEQFGGASFQLIGVDKNVIDCAFFATDKSQSLGGDRIIINSNVQTLPLSRNSRGVALYCNPNAAYFESFGAIPPDQSYIGMYLSMGFDVCVFNYRGYNRSTGVPTPSRIKSDALVVGNYICESIRSSVEVSSRSEDNRSSKLHFIVHGQSLGGMCACHIAAHCPPEIVSLLVCDRTYASLDAVAGRLLGNWAGASLRKLACWNSNNIHNFLSADCSKIVLQDPNDEIVYHASSLKCGIATFLALKDDLWVRKEQEHEFRLAQFLDKTVPLTLIGTPATALTNNNYPGNNFYSSALRYLSNPSGRGQEYILLGSGMRSDSSRFSQPLIGYVSAAFGCAFEPSPPHRYYEQAPILSECFVQSFGACLLRVHNILVRSGILIIDKGKKKTSTNSQTGSSVGADSESLSASSVIIASCGTVISAAEKIWHVLSRIGSDGCGQLLGHAISQGYDDVRAWVCCYIVWSHVSIHDEAMPSAAITLEKGLLDLKAIFQSYSSLLEERAIEEGVPVDPYGFRSSRSAGDSSEISEFCDVFKFIIESMDIIISLNSEYATLLSNDDDSTISLSSSSLALRYSRSAGHPTDGRVTLLPIHSGHNGFPGVVEVSALKALILQKL